MLTRSLLARAGQVVAIETDSELIPGLMKEFEEEIASGKLTLIEGDIRTFDLSSLPKPYYVVANIPYYITGEILRLLLSGEYKPERVTVLVQKEVAERIVRSKKESLLSLSVKVFGSPVYAFTVPRGAFRPAPNVDSAVLTVKNIHSPFGSKGEEEVFFSVLHGGFAHKRKRLAKNLESIATPSRLEHIFSELGIDTNARSEDIPLAAWIEITHHLVSNTS